MLGVMSETLEEEDESRFRNPAYVIGYTPTARLSSVQLSTPFLYYSSYLGEPIHLLKALSRIMSGDHQSQEAVVEEDDAAVFCVDAAGDFCWKPRTDGQGEQCSSPGFDP